MVTTILVSGEEYQERLSICKKCAYYTAMGTCGTLGVKTKVTHKKKKIKLCGCFMAVKCKLKFASCPAVKWESVAATKEEKDFHRKAAEFAKSVEGKNSLSSYEIEELYSYHNHTHGSKRKSSGCAPCVKTALAELQKWVTDIG